MFGILKESLAKPFNHIISHFLPIICWQEQVDTLVAFKEAVVFPDVVYA